jgi:quercetin dioxygenase-like cupin family protein
MKITRPGEVPSRRPPADYFTGVVWQDPINQAPSPARVQVARVSFDPGARTAWHTHPFGQTLYVLSGCGLVQTEGEAIHEIRPGDVVWIPPGEKHWHGAGPSTGMAHLAIQECENGEPATWMEKVTDEQYAGNSR